MTVIAAVVFFALVYPFAIDLFDAEGAQVVFGGVFAFAYGFAVGYLVPGRSRSSYLWAAGFAGLAAWTASLLYVQIFYPGAPLLGIWFFRFGVATALLFASGALVGDLVHRKELSITSSALAAAVAVAGLIVSVLQLLA